MSRIRDQLTSRANLQWAWAKAKRMYDAADGPVDWGAIATFELDLEAQLESIARDFEAARYKLEPLVLLPQPKKRDEDGAVRLRQSFHVCVRDQVAWIALANVIGPLLDSQMPAWVYGHRLYKAAWFEELDDGETRLALGPYRHSTGALYRKFKHSWPLFRRHISLSARMMVGFDGDVELDNAEKAALNYQDRPAYLTPGWWPSVGETALYYTSIDLERFYPTIKQSAIVDGLRTYLSDYAQDTWLQTLVERMLRFRVSPAGSALLGDEVVQPVTLPGRFKGIPTGLMVAGFLSNVAMLRLDRMVEDKVHGGMRIAHFRFVDDHAILAYDFDELCAWIRWYEEKLGELAIGPKISPTKFDPPIMAQAYGRGAIAADHAAAKTLTKIDGRRPSHLMTKTLALVSELAGADFDILSATSKSERLGELEWLLLADLPDREIRADTRAAFAAGRMSTLVPVATTPSLEVLTGLRDLARINTEIARLEAKRDQQGVAELREQQAFTSALVADRRHAETEVYRKRLAHYFKLMWQAFQDHPEKPRLFLRVLDYCRSTGHAGTGSILRWLNSGEDGPPSRLADYLRALAIQTIARHVATAAHDLNNPRLLERQRVAARDYLNSLVRRDTVKDFRAAVGQATETDVAATVATASLRAALAWAVEVAERSPPLRRRLSLLQAQIDAPSLSTPSAIWERLTGYPLGAWVHSLEGRGERYALGPSVVWRCAMLGLDTTVTADLQNLRKGLSQPPVPSNSSFTPPRLRLGKLSDSGLALDRLRSSQYVQVAGKLSASEARVAAHQQVVARAKSRITLDKWIECLAHASAHDPRRSEWTALEILRQLASPICLLEGPDASSLDYLHPANVLVPRAWTRPPENGFSQAWTWETWRSEARALPRAVKVTSKRIIDYRRQHAHPKQFDDDMSMWRTRLHGCGLLLLGLVSQDFRLPAYWNVRGLEGDINGFVRRQLEQIAVSSRTQGIIEAALLPRSLETASILDRPWAFYGERKVSEINDTRSDPPFIADLDDLVREITQAQSVLEARQISVLNHAPRQLIPMNISQLAGTAIEIPEMDLFE